MILSEQCYTVIRNALWDNGITAYSDEIPTETQYSPFVMYEITSLKELDNHPWAFDKDYEKLTIRFNIYSNKNNPSDAIGIGEDIEGLFDRKKNTFVDGSDGKYLVCSYKINDSIGNLDNPKYWVAISDYEFVVQRDIP